MALGARDFMRRRLPAPQIAAYPVARESRLTLPGLAQLVSLRTMTAGLVRGRLRILPEVADKAGARSS